MEYNVWKLGDTWGTHAPSFYDFIRKEQIVIGQNANNLLYKKGDYILITSGFNVKAIAFCLEDLITPIGSKAEYESECNTYKIDYDDYVLFAKASWYELSQEEQFEYKLIKGNRKVQKEEILDIVKQIIQKIENTMNKNTPVNTLLQKKQIILQGAPGTGKTRLAQMIAQELIKNGGETQLIQFHPAYSYEDFVRGIVAETNENGQINYKVKNKILAEMAQKAKENLEDSKKTPEIIAKETKQNTFFEDFKDHIYNKIQVDGGYNLTSNTKITRIDTNRFLYVRSSENSYIHFKDFLLLYDNNVIEREDIGNLDVADKVKTRSLFNYHKNLLDKFRDFITTNTKLKIEEEVKNETVKPKNYVLIIDEINRANLPAVLGELIYALEYRDRAVNCLYELDGNREIILPSNLYIIGTMNTADRSVGHIDYAIRRRFAFIPVPPDKTVIVNTEALALFEKIKSIFEKNLSADFAHSIDDIMIGHSYFLVEKDEELQIKLEYEIKPLLREYVKDGILTCEIKIINDLKI